MEKKPESNEKEKEEKEIMFVMDNLEKCSLCGKDGAYIKEEGIYICNDCFVEQKREIFILTPLFIYFTYFLFCFLNYKFITFNFKRNIHKKI